MDSENENRPLLHDFENETWRSRTRKRCIRIPSEAAITGLILGVFFLVVTLLIVLENVEKTEKDEISINKNLLAAPSFNQKLADKSWQDEKLRKLDNMNKDWDMQSDQSDSSKYDKKHKEKSWQDEKQRKFDKVNKGWKILPNVTAGRSDVGIRSLIGSDYIGDQQKINKAWRDKMIGLQLPSAPAKKDEGMEKLSEQGWKDKEIEAALIEALKKAEEDGKLSMTGSTFKGVLEKASDFIVNVRDKKDKEGIESTNYLLSPSNFHELKSYMETSQNNGKDDNMSDNNEKTGKNSSLNLALEDFIDFIIRKIKEQQKDKKEEQTNKTENGSTYFMYSSGNEKVNEKMMVKQRGLGNVLERKLKLKNLGKLSKPIPPSPKKKTPIEEDEIDENNSNADDGSTYFMYSSANSDDLIQSLLTESAIKQQGVGNVLERKLKLKNLGKLSKPIPKKKTIIDETETSMEEETKADDNESESEEEVLKSSGKMQWKNVDKGYKKLSPKGWNVKDAVNEASRKKPEILHSAMGDFDMNWQKMKDKYYKS